VSPTEYLPPKPGDTLTAPAIFILPVTALVLLSVLTDAPMLALGLESRAVSNQRPRRWRGRSLLAHAVLLGTANAALSLLWLVLALNVAGGAPPGALAPLSARLLIALGKPTLRQVYSIVYLQISLATALGALVSRSRRSLPLAPPPPALLLACLAVMCVSSALVVYYPEVPGGGPGPRPIQQMQPFVGPDTPAVAPAHAHRMKPLGWEWVAAVWAYALGSALLLDVLKALGRLLVRMCGCTASPQPPKRHLGV
jgi:hypothetical protein